MRETLYAKPYEQSHASSILPNETMCEPYEVWVRTHQYWGVSKLRVYASQNSRPIIASYIVARARGPLYRFLPPL